MPTYEYRCKSCGNTFERIQKISESSGAACPECGEEAERLISGGAGLLFRGSGFYKTDYRSDSYKKAAEKDKRSSAEATPASKDKDKTAPKGSESSTPSAGGEKKKKKTGKDSD